MMKIFYSFLFLISFSTKIASQVIESDLKDFQLTTKEFVELKNYLLSKNLEVKDTLFIKYDFNKEDCWRQLDFKSKKHINTIIENSQKNISNFNDQFETAKAYNFKEVGDDMNKLKRWDQRILIDDENILRKLVFKDKKQCGSSALILSDGSSLLYEGDSHFQLLNLHHNYTNKEF